MKYYKIYTDDIFIGIVCSTDYVTYQPQNEMLTRSNEEVGQFVDYNQKLYRDTWMKPLPNERSYEYQSAIISPITEEEYNILFSSIERNEEIYTGKQVEPEVVSQFLQPSTVTLEFVRTSKINDMSAVCRETIENGFDLELRGEEHHFSLDTQDQLNLMSLGMMAQNQSMIPYHADGENCIFYTSEEINEIIDTANAFKIYHTTYYNALKNYINALNNIEDIANIEYGIEIPEEYKTDVLRALEVE